MTRSTAGVAFGLGLMVVAPLLGQQHPNLARGFQPDQAFQLGDVDHVNLFSGNLVLTLPVGPRFRVGEQLEYGLALVNNSKVWDWQMLIESGQEYPQADPTYDNNAGFGWQLHFGRLIPPWAAMRNQTAGWLYLGPDGSEHLFYIDLQTGEDECGAAAAVCYTRDGSYLRLKKINGSMEVAFGDGTRHFFSPHGDRDEYWLDRMEDTSGNWMTVSYGATLWSVSDSTGRSHQIVVDNLLDYAEQRDIPTVKEVRLAAFAGAVATYTLTHVYAQVERPVTHTPTPAKPLLANLPLLTRLTLPDGSFWDLPVDSYVLSREESDGGDATGTLERLRLPTKGLVEWRHGTYVFAGDGFHAPGGQYRPARFLRFSPGVKSRTLRTRSGAEIGTWTYQPSITFAGQSGYEPVEQRSTVIDPNGHQTRHYFSAYDGVGIPDPAAQNLAQGWHYGLPFSVLQPDQGRFLSQELWPKGRSPGVDAPTLAEWVRYEAEGAAGHRQRVASTKSRWDGRDRIQEFSQFDGLGNFRRSVLQSDSGSCLNGTFTRTEHTHFNPGSGQDGVAIPLPDQRWILGDFSHQWEEEADGKRYREYVFDERGFMTRERIFRHRGTNRDRQDTVREIQRSSNGNLIERYYGGFAHPVGVGALDQVFLDANQAGLVDIRTDFQFGQPARRYYRNATFNLFDVTIDRDSGLVASSRDVAGVATHFEYDTMGRIVWAKPSEGASWTQYTYTPATSPSDVGNQALVEVRERAGSKTAAVIANSKFFFEDLGRLRREARRLAAGWTERRHYRDAVGNLLSRTEWQSSFTSPAATRFDDYDPFGRAGVEISPDQRVFRNAYHGNYGHQRWWYVVTQGDGVTYNDGATTESNKMEVDSTFDPMGRLCRLEEKDGLDARYEYTTRGDLKTVKLKWGPGSSDFQNRYFQYDARGFLLSHSQPESGTYVFENIDARGHANIKRHLDPDSELDLGFDYDDFERLVAVWDRSREVPIKTWQYAAANGPNNNFKKGKVEKATRFNYRQATFLPGRPFFDIPVTETYTYAAPGGRVSSRRTELNSTLAFEQSFAWDLLGNLTSQTYPRCVAPLECVGVAPGRHQAYGYSYGQLTAVGGWADLTYHVNGMLAEVRHSNGVTDHYDRDPAYMQRPYNVRVTSPFAPPAELGVHSYDGGGHLFRLRPSGQGLLSFDQVVELGLGRGLDPAPNVPGDSYFLYDTLGRVKVYQDGSSPALRQTYLYDTLGNLTQIGNVSLAVNRATNQLDQAGYDARGNLTSRAVAGSGTELYQWDAIDQLAARNQGLETHFYTVDGERVWTLRHDPNAANPVVDTLTLRGLAGEVLTTYTKVGSQYTWQSDHLHRGASALGKAMPNGASHHFTLDHLGTTRLVTSQTGAGLEAHHYYAFGTQFAGAAASTEKLRFTGHERDANNTGNTVDDLDYMHARYYATHLGRFLTTDPISGSPTRPQSWNRYSYAGNNPINATDPTGLYVVDCGTMGTKECDKRKKTLAEAIAWNKKSGNERARRAAEAYGAEGEDNGVTIAYGEAKGDASAQTEAKIHIDQDAGVLFSARVTFEDLSRENLQVLVAHEGDHVANARAFADSYDGNSLDWSLNLTTYDAEMSAYILHHEILKSQNRSMKFDGCACTLGVGLKNDSSERLKAEIEKVLRSFYGVSRNDKGLSVVKIY